MFLLICESQPGENGLSIDYLFDTSDESVMVAVDLRDYRGRISPQFADNAVLLTYADDLLWLLGGEEKPEYYSYVRSFKTYQDYCSWFNNNTLS